MVCQGNCNPEDCDNTDETTETVEELTIEQRVDIKLAVDQWLRNKVDFTDAAEQLQKSGEKLREVLKPNMRVVIKRGYNSCVLVKTNDLKSFAIEEIECI